jgi:hypothetical protein
MSGRRRTITSAFLALALIGVAPAAAVAEEVDGVCDLEISLNRAPTLLDNIVVEAYTGQFIVPVGLGFPTGSTDPDAPATWVQFDFYVDDLPRSSWIWQIAPDGSVNADRYNPFSFGRHGPIDPVGVGGEVRATWLGEGEECADSVLVTHLGPIPYFNDIMYSRFIREIVALAEAGVVEGCGPLSFCPSSSITREEMAAFMARALELPETAEDFFDDDDGRPLEWAINRMAAAGIATGCGELAFCPTRRVTRAEMSAFLVRGFELPASDVDRFTDDDGHTLEASINALAAAGVTTGCRSGDPTRFCPDLFVKRDEMAAFVYRALHPAP